MDRQRKLQILGQGSDHDQDGLPAGGGPRLKSNPFGIYAAKSKSGPVPLMRTMMTSSCAKSCGYCPFGLNVDFRRATWKREELVKTVLELDQAGLAKGLFLTSGLAGNAVRVMDRMLETVRILRDQHAYRGYVHLKILPGAEDDQIAEALCLADRVSVNLEAPTDQALVKIAPEKSLASDLALRIKAASRLALDRGNGGPTGGGRLRAGIVTQFVVGPGGETDRLLLSAVDRLYRQYRVRRAYYSAFTPVLGTPMEDVPPESPLRESRLYQADWLLRFYGFALDELPLDQQGSLPRDRDPKLAWALAQKSIFPLEINRAAKELLLRVPGLGPTSVERILRARRRGRLSGPDDLTKLGVRAKIAQSFLLFEGRHYPGPRATLEVPPEQLELFAQPRGFGRLAEDRRRINPSAGGTYV